MLTHTPSPDSIFCEAIEIASAEERAVYLAEACGHDTELQARLERLVAAHFQAGSFLEQPALAEGAAAAPTQGWDPDATGGPSDPTGTPAAGVPVVPGYEFLGELGRGGMGVVYKARQKTLKRLAALKMILAGGYAGQAELARFRTEAEAIARLCHPNIVQVYEVGEHDGRPFVALEYVDGGTLQARLRQQLPEAREAAELVETLARAVGAVHQCHIVHRDLKPANVLLAACGFAEGAKPQAALVPKISDFGLAKKLDDDSGQTASGMLLGTPSYMAPEQAEGRAADVGPATDIYALGAILYECLTGRPPFRAATVQQTVAQVIHEEPAAPRHLNPATPRDLEIIALKCLQKDPKKRYATAGELADDLRRFLDGRPIRARRVPAWERALKWARHHKAQALFAFTAPLLVVAVAAGGVLYGLLKGKEADLVKQQFQQELSDRNEVDAHVASADEEVRLAADEVERVKRLAAAMEHVNSALALLDSERLADSDDLRARIVERRDRIARLQMVDDARRKFAAQIAGFQPLRHEVHLRQLSVADRDRDADRAAVRRAAAAALAQFDLRAADTPEKAARCLEACSPYLPAGQSARRLAEGCCAVLLAWADAEDPPEALHLLDLATALGESHHVAALRTFHLRRARYLARLGAKTAADAERKEGERLPPESAFDLFQAALDAYGEGKTAEAAAFCEQVCLREPDHFWAWYVRGMSCFSERRWLEAKVSLTACLGTWPDFFWARLFRATAEGELREFTESEADFRAVLEQTDDPLAHWLVLTNRGAMRVRRQAWDDGVADLKEATRLRPDGAEAYVNLAQAYGGRKDYPKAITILDRALERRPDHPGLYHTRAQLHALRGDREAARKDFEQAIELTPKDSTQERLASDCVELAHLQHQAKEYKTALGWCDYALERRSHYTPAYRQRAETLLALGKDAGAGRALDDYLLHKGEPTAEVYQARGLIHAKFHEYEEAIEAYDRALRLRRDADTLGYRGWAYLRLGSSRAALIDFEAALRLKKEHTDALCGRGCARVRLGQVAPAVEDAEAALRHDPRNPHVHFRAASIYAQAVGRLDAEWGARAWTAGPAGQYQARAVELLAELMRGVPEKDRKAYWHHNIQDEKDLAPISRSDGFLNLGRTWER